MDLNDEGRPGGVVVCVSSERAVQRVLRSLTRYIEQRLELRVNRSEPR